MRVLVTSWAWPTHFFPVVPLCWALRTAGHEVCVTTQPPITGHVTRAGLPVVPVGRGVDAERMIRERMHDASSVASTTGGRPDDETLRHIVRTAYGMFAEIATDMVDDLLTLATAWAPDAVVFEPTTYAGPAVAAALGVPAVRQLWGVDYTGKSRPYEGGLLDGLAARVGVDAVESLGDLTVDPCPPQVQHDVDVDRLPTRYVPYNGPGTLPRWLLEPSRRPRVCVTWGTSTSRVGADLSLTAELLRRIGTAGIEVVAAVSDRALESLPTDLANLRVVENLPLHLLLPGCDAVVQQGGMGTSMTAMVCGTPQVMVPQLPDQTFNARIMAHSPAVTHLSPERARSPGVLAELVEQVAVAGEARTAATALRDDALDRPPPHEVVAAIEKLAHRRGPGTA